MIQFVNNDIPQFVFIDLSKMKNMMITHSTVYDIVRNKDSHNEILNSYLVFVGIEPATNPNGHDLSLITVKLRH